MPLTEDQVLAQFEQLKTAHETEKHRLDRIHDYLRDDPTRRLQGLPKDAPDEVHRLAKLSRVNMLKFVVNSRVQSMYVDGFRARGESDNAAGWEVWQANRMDARQIGVHRAALSYGASYESVLPGDPLPVLRGATPRHMTALYGNDDDWPVLALEKRRAMSGELWRLFDEEAVYWVQVSEDTDRPELVTTEIHDAGRVPVVRFRDTDDLDDPVVGIVEPLIPLQDQINLTTFGLLVAQHYGAFKQRYIIGWMAESESERLKVAASKLFTVEDNPGDVEIGEWSETDLSGYIESRKASMEQLATISQTPAHELLGQLVNLSAEALAAAEAGKRRAIGENQRVMGESHEQALGLASEFMGSPVDAQAEVRWTDTESRALATLVDALGKAVTMLGIPPQAMWERIADALGESQTAVDSWKRLADEMDPMLQVAATLDRQTAAVA